MSTRYVVKAWKTWQQVEPETATFVTETEARAYARGLPHGLIDLIERSRGGRRNPLIGVRRVIAWPGSERDFTPRDDFS